MIMSVNSHDLSGWSRNDNTMINQGAESWCERRCRIRVRRRTWATKSRNTRLCNEILANISTKNVCETCFTRNISSSPLDKKTKDAFYSGLISIWSKILANTSEKVDCSQLCVFFFCFRIQHFFCQYLRIFSSDWASFELETGQETWLLCHEKEKLRVKKKELVRSCNLVTWNPQRRGKWHGSN